jgi:hypothetical protein
MSLPLFSQTAISTDSLISIPTQYARQIASELILYDLCQQERDSLKAEINDMGVILENHSILLGRYETLTDSLVTTNQEAYTQISAFQLDINNKDEKISKLRNARNVTFITTLLTAVLPVILRNE